ncbi:MAG TPA: TIGR00266 family protein [Methanofastidiosum sp.]|nr:TIGR00266 family protein [Methanofastidiosum sp.]HOT84181.1 TIGR00266 family protein [Methanofastidiosum sp.]HPC80606.1 TIGR00266 family protein [Methanofastidiosum sp.]HQF89143.1 TIGR00266 family protein [Methanofastidiosum sp.]HQG61150.1 TIGR00266 family protein [Methanofastidiosum sp.]
MAFCPSCGSQNPDGSKFCTGCGAKFGSSDANPGFSSVGGQGYDFEIKDKPVFSILNVNLKSGQSIVAEAGAMVSMTPNVSLKTEMKGGLGGALKRGVLGGESLFMNTYTSNGSGTISFAPGYPGDITHIKMKGETWFLERGAYMCSSPEVVIDTKFQGLKGLVSGEGLFFLKADGFGDLFITNYGSLIEKELKGESFKVDTGHLVAFSSGITYNVERAGGSWKSTILSGEGLIANVSGNGKVLMQTRCAQSLAQWLAPFMPSSGGGGIGGIKIG